MQIVFVIALAITAYLLFVSKFDNKLLERAAHVAAIVSAAAAIIVLAFYTFSGTEPLEEQATATSQLTSTSTIADALTPHPTQSMTSVPSETAAPTETVAPIETPTLAIVLPTEPSPLPLPFTDNFDTGLRSEWQVLSGTPIISNGILKSANDDLTIQTGYINTENYSVGFDFYCNFSLSVVFAETVKVRFVWSKWEIQTFDNNRWHTIDEIRDLNTCKMNTLQRVEINVTKNVYDFVFNGEKVYEGKFGNANLGPLTITLDEYQRFDNLTIHGN